MSEEPTADRWSDPASAGADDPGTGSSAAATPEAGTPEAGTPGADGVGEQEAAGLPDGADGAGATPVAGRRRRDPLAAFLIGVLTLLLGFAFAVQVRSTDTDQQLAGLREEDLVRILDDLSSREDRLRQEINDQRAALAQLGSSDSAAAAALAEAEERAEALGILNGTVAARGPGLEVVIRDPADRITAGVVLNAIQELRGAGAETMQIDGVRIGVSSAITGEPGALEIDGEPVEAPYTIRVIGSPEDMATALSIPGGVSAMVNQRRGDVAITPSQDVVVDALRPLDTPQYAEPAEGD
ncbi:DUF881 domain-containing protein [Modestobacter sp. KNN46-3]|jgi:uncharacterized protein YlxW (UPF0749 family)|uniref:DUF881 domain-containing protein n=1 Tax=Modestobacter sp. KNN46-3 TaxID=2711218 RepID=UPI0013E066CB|nr:DUF881 domain-containing protein [Modestobacter sp. KNN46-3]